MKTKKFLIIDGEKAHLHIDGSPLCAATFANSPVGTGRFGNAEFVEMAEFPEDEDSFYTLIYVSAIKDICAGEEIFIDYGSTFPLPVEPDAEEEKQERTIISEDDPYWQEPEPEV